MKKDNKNILLGLIGAIIFFIAGKLFFFRIFALFEPSIKGIYFQITERTGKFPTSILFSFQAALVPILIALIWRTAPVVSTIRRAGVVLIIIFLMLTGILLRHQLVKSYFSGVVRPFLKDKHQLPMNYPIDPANFVYYMFAGCCIGCVVSFFLFRQKNIMRPAS